MSFVFEFACIVCRRESDVRTYKITAHTWHHTLHFMLHFYGCVYGYLSGSVVFVTFLNSHECLRNKIRLPKIGFTQVSYGIFFSDGLVNDILPNSDRLVNK